MTALKYPWPETAAQLGVVFSMKQRDASWATVRRAAQQWGNRQTPPLRFEMRCLGYRALIRWTLRDG